MKLGSVTMVETPTFSFNTMDITRPQFFTTAMRSQISPVMSKPLCLGPSQSVLRTSKPMTISPEISFDGDCNDCGLKLVI